MSETSALSLSQADGAAEVPTPVAAPAVAETSTTLQLLNQAMFDYGVAHLNEEVARDAQGVAYDAAAAAEAKMKALYKQLQDESRAQGGAK